MGIYLSVLIRSTITPLILLLFPGSIETIAKAAEAKPHLSAPHFLTRSFVQFLAPLRPDWMIDPNAELEAGAILECDPYCELVGKVFYTNLDSFQDGLRVDPPLKEVMPSKKWRLFPVGSKAYRNLSLSNSSSTSLTKTSSSPSSMQQNPLLAWRVGAIGSGFIATRSLSTTANTQTQTDSNPYGIYLFGLNLRTPAIFDFLEGSSFLDIYSTYNSGIFEQSSQSTAGNTLNSERFDFKTIWGWSPLRSHSTYHLLLGVRFESLTATPGTPLAFSTQDLLGYLGVAYQYKAFYAELSSSIVQSTQDVVAFRGSQLSTSFFEFNIQYCLKPFIVLSSPLQMCFPLGINWTLQTGSSDPIRSIFTANPQYSYWTSRVGVSFSWDFYFYPSPENPPEPETPKTTPPRPFL